MEHLLGERSKSQTDGDALRRTASGCVPGHACVRECSVCVVFVCVRALAPGHECVLCACVACLLAVAPGSPAVAAATATAACTESEDDAAPLTELAMDSNHRLQARTFRGKLARDAQRGRRGRGSHAPMEMRARLLAFVADNTVRAVMGDWFRKCGAFLRELEHVLL